MKPEQYSERKVEAAGWPVRLASYRLGQLYYAKADNVSPGACVARATGASREEAESQALDEARQRLARTRRQGV